MDMLAGQGVGLAGEIRPAAEIVHTIADEARAVIAQRFGAPDKASFLAEGAVEAVEHR